MNKQIKEVIANTICRLTRKKIIILSGNGAGLGNRLKRMASFHAYYGLNDTQLYWNPKGWVSASFTDLFCLDEVERFHSYSINLHTLCGYTYPSLGEGDFWRLKIAPEEIDKSFFIERGSKRFLSVDFRFNSIPKNVRKKYMSFFGKLKPSPEVRRRLDRVKFNKNVVCVHVRNPVRKSDKKQDCANIDWFVKHMHQYPDQQRFFLSTMGTEYSKKFHSEFGNRIIELPEKKFDSMIDAVADMYLLGMGEKLVVSSGSTFSEVSWWLGGCSQPVIIAPQI